MARSAEGSFAPHAISLRQGETGSIQPSRSATLRPADNPFRVERIHSIDYAPQGTTWDDLLARLAELRYRAAVVGPHGSGKTTLLRSLASRLAARGLRPVMLFRNADEPRGGGWPDPWRSILANVGAGDVLLVDGYNHLSPIARLRLRRVARHAAGLVGTAHRRCDLRTLVRTASSPDVLRWVVSQLTDRPLNEAAARELLARHEGNLREALWELYDRAG